MDGRLNDWKEGDFVQIDSRTKAALAISGDHLFAAFKTNDPNLLQNHPEALQNIFKTGGALDLMLDAIPGGLRLLVAQSEDKTIAMLYRPKVPGTTTEPVKFTSPPFVLRIFPLELFLDLRIALAPEILQIVGDLDRTMIRRENLNS